MCNLSLLVTLTTCIVVLLPWCAAGTPQLTSILGSVGGFGLLVNPSSDVVFVSTVNSITALTQTNGNVLVADVGGSTVLSVDPSTGAATAGFTPVTGVESPAALVALNDVLFVLTPTGIFTASASAGGAASTSAVLPISAMSLGAASNNHSWVSMCVDPQRSFLYYADYTAGALYRSHMSTSGVLTVDSSFHVTGLGNPNSCAVAADGTVVVSDYTGNRMWEVQTGVLTGAAALFSDSLTNSTYPSLSAPGCVALDAAGNLFIAETASGTSGVHLIRSLYI